MTSEPQALLERLATRARSMTGEHGWSADDTELHELLYDAHNGIEALSAQNEAMAEALREAGPIIARYTVDNPKWHLLSGETQDPMGAHALLEKINALNLEGK